MFRTTKSKGAGGMTDRLGVVRVVGVWKRSEGFLPGGCVGGSSVNGASGADVHRECQSHA